MQNHENMSIYFYSYLTCQEKCHSKAVAIRNPPFSPSLFKILETPCCFLASDCACYLFTERVLSLWLNYVTRLIRQPRLKTCPWFCTIPNLWPTPPSRRSTWRKVVTILHPACCPPETGSCSLWVQTPRTIVTTHICSEYLKCIMPTYVILFVLRV